MKNTQSFLKAFLVILLLSLVYISCENQDNFEESDQTLQLPLVVKEQLESVQKNLVKHTKGDFQLLGYSSVTKNNLEKSNGNEIIAIGNIWQPETITIGSIASMAKNQKTALFSLDNYKKSAISENDSLLQLTWKKGDQTFITKCYYNDQGIIWDNVMMGLVMMDPVGEKILHRQKSTYARGYGHRWWVNWLWGSKRGEIEYNITIYYDENRKVTNTDHSNYGYMQMGQAESESRVLINSGDYGKVQYALGVSTPTGDLRFNHEYFSVSFDGLGSNLIQNGEKSLYP